MSAYDLEVPAFASLFRAPGLCTDPNSPCNECCSIVSDPACRLNFGLDTPNGPNNPIPECVCHDVCVEEVTLIAAKEVHEGISYPPVGRCRLGPNVTLPPLPPNAICNLYVVCAGEELGPGCNTITNTIGLMILCGTVAIPLTVTITYDTFYDFPTCTPVTGTALQTRIKEIDGSCKVIQLRATTNATGTCILVDGKVVDKLWRYQNLWLTGLRPFDISQAQRDLGFISITAEQEFNTSHAINPCGTNTCGG